MVQRRSRRAQRKPPEVVPPKSDEEPDAAEAGDANTAESEEENNDTNANTNTTANGSRPRRTQRARKAKGAESSENEDDSSDEGKSQENTDTGASSDGEESSNSKSNQSRKGTRRQKKPAETDEAGKKTPRRRGRPRKNVEYESNDEEGGDGEKETIRKSKRRNAGRRKLLDDSSSASEDEEPKKIKRRRGRPRKNQDVGDSDSKVESASEEEPTKTVKRKRGRPRKNRDVEDDDSKMEIAEEEESGSDKESAKKVTRRRGRPRKNQDVEDNDSKMDSANEESADEEDKPKRRRGRPRKKEGSEDSGTKAEMTEEDDGSGDDENESDGNRKSSSNRTIEGANNDETTPRPKRRRGRPKKLADASSNDEGEKEAPPEAVKAKGSTRQTPNPSSNDEQSSEEEGTRKRGRSGRPRSASTDKGSNEANENLTRKRGRGRQTPPLATGDEEPSGSNLQKQASKCRLERIDEIPPVESASAAPPKNNTAQGPTVVNNDKLVVKEEAKATTTPKDKDGTVGSSSQPAIQERKKESRNGSATEISTPSRRAKRQRVPPEQLVDGSVASSSNIAAGKDNEPEAHDKKRPRMEVGDIANDAIEMAAKPAKPVATQVGPSSNEMKAQSFSMSDETKDMKKDESKHTTTTTPLDGKGLKPVHKIPVLEKIDAIKEATRSAPTDTPKKPTPPKETKTETDVVPPATTDSNEIVVKEESQKRELRAKGDPLVTKSVAKASSEPKQVGIQTNDVAAQNKVQQTGMELSLVPKNSKPKAEKASLAKSLQPTKKVESSGIGKVEPADPTTSAILKKKDQSATCDEKIQEDKTESKSKKAETKGVPDSNRASNIDVDSTAKDVEMVDAEEKKPPPAALQNDNETSGALNHPKGPQSKTSESTQTVRKATETTAPIDRKEKIAAGLGVGVSIPEFPTKTVNKAAESTAPIESEGRRSAHVDIGVSTAESPTKSVNKAAQTTAPSESEGGKLADAGVSITELPTKSVPSETVVSPKGTILSSADSNAEVNDSKEELVSEKNSSNCVESSPVTESSGDEDESDSESDNEEVEPEARFETKVLPFKPPSAFPTKKQSSSELIGNKVTRVKLMLYAIGSRVHRGRGFERLFSKYWNALTMLLTDRLSSHASRQCNATIKAFLKSPKLRRIHNKLVLTLMKTSMKSFAPLNEIFEHVPEQWQDKVKRVDRVVVDGEETKRRQKARAKRAAREHATIYREAWTSTPMEENPIAADCLKTESQEVDMKKIIGSSAAIPGAIVIDPLVREAADKSNMRASENAIWLLIVAAREHTSNILKNALKQKKDMEKGEVSDPFLQYPRVIAGTKVASKRDLPAEKNVQQPPPASVDYIPGKCQTRKVVTSFDIYASSFSAPAGAPGALGGAVSTTALEVCLQNAYYTSSSDFTDTNFSPVHKHIIEGITALAQDRKAMLLGRGEEAKSNKTDSTNSRQQIATNAQNIVPPSNSVVSNANAGAVAKSSQKILTNSQRQVATNAQNILPSTSSAVSNANVGAVTSVESSPARGLAHQHQNLVPAPKPVVVDAQKQQQKNDAIPSISPTNVASAPSNIPVAQSNPVGASSGRVGTKDLSALLKRNPKPSNSTDPAPVSDDKAKVVTESSPPSVNLSLQKEKIGVSSPQKDSSPQKEKNEVDELGSSTGSGRRRLGFGTKNLAAMKARSSKPGEEKESPRTSVPNTASTNESEKQQVNTSTRPTGGKDLASMKGLSGAKDLAALKARSTAIAAATKAREEAGKKNELTDQTVKKTEGRGQLGEAKSQGAIEPKSDTKEIAASSKVVGPAAASVPSTPPNTTKATAPFPASDQKLDSTKAANPAEVKTSDVPTSIDTKTGDKSSKGDYNDDSSVQVVEAVKPPVQNLIKDTTSSETKDIVASSEKPIEQMTKEKDANATGMNTQPKPASTTEKPDASSADISRKEDLAEKKEAGVSEGVSMNAEVKGGSSETKEDQRSQNIASSQTASATRSDPAAGEDAPKPKGPERSIDTSKSAESGKVIVGNPAEPGKTKAGESDASKPEEKKAGAGENAETSK